MKYVTLDRMAGLTIIVAGLCAGPAFAQTDMTSQDDKPAAFVTAYADIRYRLEFVDQQGIAKDAMASTLRVRTGLQTGEWQGLSAVIEAEAILAIGKERFNDTINSRTQYPVVADPEDILLNQAYIRWKPDRRIEVTAGRQAVNLDNQRWIGSVGWRQNDQTLDAVKLSLKPMAATSIDYFHAWRVNRIFGSDSPQGIWRDNDIDGVRGSFKAQPLGMISGYGYWLDIPSAPALSSRTLGVRLSGDQPIARNKRVLYAFEYARQQDFGANPQKYSLDYMLVEAGLAAGSATAKIGLERLEGNGVSALQTPLATLHAFNGWADKFLVTPPNGLQDLYVDLGYRFGKNGPLKGSLVKLVYHDFRSTRLDMRYGSEWGAMVSVPIHKNLVVQGKLARYGADRFASDTLKAWFSIDAKF